MPEEWGSWLRDLSGYVIKGAADAEYRLPFESQKLALQAYGDAGYYLEGQRGVAPRPQGLTLSPTVLLIGGVVLLLLLKD